MDLNTLRVLELDGGGTRGVFSMEGLASIMEGYRGLDAKQLPQLFDVITGTSIGGICAVGLCCGKSPRELYQLIYDNAYDIFDAFGWTFGNHKATYTDMSAYITGAQPALYYTSGTDPYENTPLKTLISSIVGTKNILDIKDTVLIIPVVQYVPPEDTSGHVRYRLVSNLVAPWSTQTYADYDKDAAGNPKKDKDGNLIIIHKPWTLLDLCLATSAAPMYLPQWQVGKDIYIDGGLAQNNMAPFALEAGQSLKPNSMRSCLLSMGTGLRDAGGNQETPANGAFDGFFKITNALGNSLTLHQELGDEMLNIRYKNSRRSFYKYRFNTFFDKTKSALCDLDSSDKASLDYMAQVASDLYQADLPKINQFMDHLLL